MNERYLEENITRLIRAAFGPEARPSRQTVERTLQSLLALIHARSAAVAFPDAAVGVLGGMLVLIASWLAIQLAFTGTSMLSIPALLAMAAWLTANVALLPVASILILIMRQRG